MHKRLSALLSICVCLQASAGPAAWRLTGTNDNEIVLLGSVHYLRDEDYPLPAVIDQLYDRADALVMELDLDDIDPLQTQSAFLKAAMLPAGTSLPDVLDADIYALAQAQARALGIDSEMLQRFEPWLVAITMLDLGLSRLGFRADRGLEQRLLARARSDHKEVLGLETLEAQIAIFDRLTILEQQSLLEQTLNELTSADDAMSELVDAWRRGELEPLADTLMGEFADFPELYETLVVERNESWIAKLETLLADGGNYLVVVGALHLVGRHSVIDLLHERGFDVVPLDEQSR